MDSNNVLNFQVSMTILNACTKEKSGNILNAPRTLKIKNTLTEMKRKEKVNETKEI